MLQTMYDGADARRKMMLLVDIVGAAGGDDGKSIRMESSILLSPGVSGI